MVETDWQNPALRAIGIRLSGDSISESDPSGRRIRDDTFLILLNGFPEMVPFKMPASEEPWLRIFDTFLGHVEEEGHMVNGEEPYKLEGRSIVLFQMKRQDG